MTTQETRAFLNRIYSVFPNFIRQNTDKDETVRAWSEAFEGIELQDAMNAFDIYSHTSKFPPSIADILQCVPMESKYNSDENAFEQIKKLYLKIIRSAYTEDVVQTKLELIRADGVKI